MRGVTISCWGWGREWNSPGMAEAIDEIHALGGNWISFHPYAWIDNDGAIRHRNMTDDPTVLNPIREAHRRGVKVMLKPHLGYWGSKFQWRGDISFDNEADWQRFFAGYVDFMVTQAIMAEKLNVGLFCIGVEYKQTIHREQDWRKVIEAVRQVYSGKLVYAANWDTFDKVPFWDAVDTIGVQAYFPLTETPNPVAEQLVQGWDDVLVKVRTFAAEQNKSVIFTELGYNRAAHAAARPWDHQQGGPNADAIKLRCMKVALSRVEQEPTIIGVFLWKWFPTSRDSRTNYMLQYDEMRDVLRNAWR